MPRHTTVVVDDVSLHVEEDGAGEPLLLLHGLTGTGADWAHVFDLAALASSYRVIRPDARGHGRSSHGGLFTFARCGADVLAILDQLGIESVRAVGMSLGAKTLLHVATQAPDRIVAQVLVSATPRFPEATRALFRAAAAADHTPEEWAAMREQHVHGDAQIAALWTLPAGFAENATDMAFTPERLAAIRAETLVVAGDRDPLYPVELAVELYRALPRGSLCVVPGGGHSPVFGDEREAFARRALGLLESA